jgi:hypothetical protein
LEQEKKQQHDALRKGFAQRMNALEEEFAGWKVVLEDIYTSIWNAFCQTQ